MTTYEEKVTYLKSIGYIPLSKLLGQTLKVMCKNKHIFSRPYSKFTRGTIQCMQCEQEAKIASISSLGFTNIVINKQMVRV